MDDKSNGSPTAPPPAGEFENGRVRSTSSRVPPRDGGPGSDLPEVARPLLQSAASTSPTWTTCHHAVTPTISLQRCPPPRARRNVFYTSPTCRSGPPRGAAAGPSELVRCLHRRVARLGGAAQGVPAARGGALSGGIQNVMRDGDVIDWAWAWSWSDPSAGAPRGSVALLAGARRPPLQPTRCRWRRGEGMLPIFFTPRRTRAAARRREVMRRCSASERVLGPRDGRRPSGCAADRRWRGP